LKQEIDSINPAIVRQQPISYKVALFLKRTRLPAADEVLDIVYKRRETVQTTIDEMKQGLWKIADDLSENQNDLISIYEGLLSGQRLIERDIFFGQLLSIEVRAYLLTIKDDNISKENIEQFLAELTTQVLALQTEENANVQFFTGSQMISKLTRQQINNIRNLTRLLEKSVLANLGLRVAAAELSQSLRITDAMSQSIGQTIADTGEQLNAAGDTLVRARSSALVNIDELERGCNALNDLLDKQAEANRQVIVRGAETSNRLVEMTQRLRGRISNNDGNIVSLQQE
jgi:hypothetical protein